MMHDLVLMTLVQLIKHLGCHTRPAPCCPSSASLSFFLFLWKGNVSADEGEGRENKILRPPYSAAVPRRATPRTLFGFSVTTEKNLVQEPGAVPFTIHAAADTCHHHHGNRRGKSVGCGHVGRRLADQQLGGSGQSRKRPVRGFAAHLTQQMITSIVTSYLKSRFKLNYVCIQNDSKNQRKKYIQNHMYLYSPCPRYGGKIKLFEMDNSNVYA